MTVTTMFNPDDSWWISFIF